MDDSLIIEIWDVFKEYVPDKNKEMAANQFVDFLIGKDVDNDTLNSLLGYDSYLDDAIELALDSEEPYEDEGDDGSYEDEDEDY